MNEKRKRPKDRAGWDQRYVDKELPWDVGTPDLHLRAVIEAHGIQPCRALEIGCGTGTNSIYLAGHGFEMTGVDLAPTAIARAEAKAAAAGAGCRLFVADFLVDPISGAPFEFVYDRGCFHVFDSSEERSRFAARVGKLLARDEIWYSLIGSTDGPRATRVPRGAVPRRSSRPSSPTSRFSS